MSGNRAENVAKVEEVMALAQTKWPLLSSLLTKTS